MIVVLVILTSAIQGALFVAAIEYGRYLEKKNKKVESNGVEITKENIDAISKLVDWHDFNGE